MKKVIESSTGKEFEKLKKEIYKWAEEHLLLTSVLCPALNQDVVFNKNGLKKSILTRKSYDKSKKVINILELFAVKNLPQLLKIAELEESKSDKRNRNTIKAIHVISTKFNEYKIEIIIRETTSGTFYYWHTLIKKEDLLGSPREGNKTSHSWHIPPSKSSTTKINKKHTKKTNIMAKKKVTKSKSTPKTGVKANGQLKKGFRYAKGGRVVKAKKK